MKLKNILLAAAGAVAAISVFLPWYAVSIFGINLSANGFGEGVTFLGILTILIGLGAAVWNILMMLGKINLKLTQQKMSIINTVIGGLMVLFGIIAIIIINSQTEGLAHPGFGIYMLIIAGIATIVMAWVKMNKTIGEAPKKAEKK